MIYSAKMVANFVILTPTEGPGNKKFDDVGQMVAYCNERQHTISNPEEIPEAYRTLLKGE